MKKLLLILSAFTLTFFYAVAQKSDNPRITNSVYYTLCVKPEDESTVFKMKKITRNYAQNVEKDTETSLEFIDKYYGVNGLLSKMTTHNKD